MEHIFLDWSVLPKLITAIVTTPNSGGIWYFVIKYNLPVTERVISIWTVTLFCSAIWYYIREGDMDSFYLFVGGSCLLTLYSKLVWQESATPRG